MNFAEKNVTVGGIASTVVAVPYKEDAWFLAVPVHGAGGTISVFTGGLGRDGTLAVGEAMVEAVRAGSGTTPVSELFPETIAGMNRVSIDDGTSSQRVFVAELRSDTGEVARLMVTPGGFDRPGARVGWALEQGTEEITPAGLTVHRVDTSEWDGEPYLRWDDGSGHTINASGASLLAEPGLTAITVAEG